MTKKLIYYTLYGVIGFSLLLLIGLNLFGFRQYVVVSDSMAPAIRINSLVIVKIYDSDDLDSLNPGDIVAINTGKIPVMHRIVAIDKDKVTTKGDANDQNDQPISIHKVIGKVIFVIPFIGFLFTSIYPWLSVLLIILIVAIVRQIRKEIKKNQSSLDENQK